MDSKLTFRDHISYVTSKASMNLGFMFRIAKHFRNTQCLKTLYCSLVRSILEYAAVVWAPFYQISIIRLESIQHKFVRFALRFLPWNNPQDLPCYEDKCKLLGLDLLSTRQDVAKAMFIADLIQFKIDCPCLLQQINFDIQRRNLRVYHLLRLSGARTNYGHHEVVRSMCRVFNRCSDFDFNLSRNSVRQHFFRALR